MKAEEYRAMLKTVAADTANMNKLQMRLIAWEIVWWGFEPITFRLAKRTRYTPDFGILFPGGEFELIEVKATWTGGGRTRAGWKEDSRVKWKVAQEMYYMFKFRAVRRRTKREGGGFEEVS